MTRALLLACLLALLPAGAQAQTFAEHFETCNGGQFGFTAIATGVIPSGRTITCLPTGGFNGTGGGQIEVNGCTSDCDTSTNQGQVGWKQTMGGSYSLGDGFFLRFRIKMLSNIGDTSNAKFFIRGSVSGERFMTFLTRPYSVNSICQPSGEGNDYYGTGGGLPADTDPTNAFLTASDYGLGGTFGSFASGDMSPYAMIVQRINIGSNCAAFSIIPNRAAVADIKPQQNGAISDNGWVSYQIQAVSGNCGSADFRVWANNNVEASPTTQMIDMNIAGGLCDMGVTGWEGDLDIGGYWGQGSTSPTSFVLDDVEVGTTFDANYYVVQGGGASPTYRFRFRAEAAMPAIEGLTLTPAPTVPAEN